MKNYGGLLFGMVRLFCACAKISMDFASQLLNFHFHLACILFLAFITSGIALFAIVAAS